jgi:hypothetical protein
MTNLHGGGGVADRGKLRPAGGEAPLQREENLTARSAPFDISKNAGGDKAPT